MILITIALAFSSWLIYSFIAGILRALTDIPHLAGAILIEEWDKRTANKKKELEELRSRRKEEKKQKRADAKLLKSSSVKKLRWLGKANSFE